MTSLAANALSTGPKAPAPRPSRYASLRGARVWRYLGLGAGAALALSLAVSARRGRGSVPVETVVMHGAPSVKHTQKGGSVRWRQQSTMVLIDASVDALGPQAREAVRSAFGSWLGSELRLPSITFANAQGLAATTKPDGKNTVVFAPIQVPGHERDLAITLTYSDEESGDIMEADIVINAAYPYALLQEPGKGPAPEPQPPAPPSGNPPQWDHGWDHDHRDGTDGPGPEKRDFPHVDSALRSEQRSSCVAQRDTCSQNVYDLENVMTHEAGHFFGLGEDLNDTSATMYLCTNRCETHKRELTNSDKAVLTALYAEEPETTPEGAGCAIARSALGAASGAPSRASRTLTAGFLCVLLTFLVARRRRHQVPTDAK